MTTADTGFRATSNYPARTDYAGFSPRRPALNTDDATTAPLFLPRLAQPGLRPGQAQFSTPGNRPTAHLTSSLTARPAGHTSTGTRTNATARPTDQRPGHQVNHRPPQAATASLAAFAWSIPGAALLIAGLVLHSVFAARAASCNTLMGRLISHFSASTGCTAAKTGAAGGTLLIALGVLSTIAALAYGFHRYNATTQR